MSTHLLGALYALIAAALYGGADFSGGVVARRLNHYQALMITAITGAVIMLIFNLISGEGLPTTRSIFYAVLAHVFGAIGLATLYNGLAHKRASIVAPSSAVVASAALVVYSAFIQGLPGAITSSGFALAAVGVWLTTRTSITEEDKANDGLLEGTISGLAFGGFFIFIAHIEPGYFFSPFMFGKLTSALIALVVVLYKRLPIPNPVKHPIALFSGCLDIFANVLYLTATSLTRIDIAAVLVCTYPAVTVVLAMLIFKEKNTLTQNIGVLICIIAIAMIIA